MITFAIAIAVLIAGYFIYGKFIDKMFGADPSRATPSVSKADGMDYVSMPTWKIYMIQFLNIAGLGPIFGAIMGAKFGTAAYLWIVFGTIFAGAVYDYLSGMISLRNGGESLPQLIGRYLGNKTEKVMIFFVMILMILVGAVFVSQPADLLGMLTPESLNSTFWVIVIFIYYLVATMFPINKIIGRIYPVFAIALLFMAAGLLVMLFVHHPDLPEMWNGFGTKYETNPIFPMMFISISCGAISGFHATQSPLMARCIKSEKYGRPVFYGAMVTEGLVALIWAAIAIYYFQNYGTDEPAGRMVLKISNEWLGKFGGILAVLGVIAAPLSTGDTALRSARLIIADFLHLEQKKIRYRLYICVPLFLITGIVLLYSLSDKNGFAIIWRYVGWLNQLLAVFTLWAISVYLVNNRKMFVVTVIPALFMTYVVASYIMVSPEGLELAPWVGHVSGSICTFISALYFFVWKKRKGPQMLK